MDQKQIIGIFLIVGIFLLMPTYMEWMGLAPQPQEESQEQIQPQEQSTEEVLQNSALSSGDLTVDNTESMIADSAAQPAAQALAPVTETIAPVSYTIDTPILRAEFSNAEGGRFSKWELKKYDYFDGGSVNLASNNNGFDIEFSDRNGKRIQLKSFTMQAADPEGGSFELSEENPVKEIELYAPYGHGRIVKTYRFHYNRYTVDILIRMENVQGQIVNRYYSALWENGLPRIEENIADEALYSIVMLSTGGSTDDFYVDADEENKQTFTGSLDWSAVRNKYFTAAILPGNGTKIENLLVEGQGVQDSDENDLGRLYNTIAEVPLVQNASHIDTFTVYAGPLDYSILSKNGSTMHDMVLNTGLYERTFRWISIYLILPAFKFLHEFIPNYGLVIIIFSVLVKLLLYPLTKKSYESTARMTELRPKMQEIQEKYKNEPQRLQKETMNLYREEGVNPLGGCLPMLLQMPLLVALFTVFRSTIQLRGEPFVAWITDLSLPDQLPLPFELPFLGAAIAILPFFMGITMLFQSMATVTDPKQKAFVYMMPVMLTFFFYTFPSGLNLYYSVFNLLTWLQTRMIKKNMKAESATPAAAAAASRVKQGLDKPTKSGAAALPKSPKAKRKKKKQK